MKKTISDYRNFLFMCLLINLFALIINLFGIEGKIDSYNENYLFTHDSESNLSHINQVWPSLEYETINLNGNDHVRFNGIFYRYDISEFILYMTLLFLWVLFKTYIAKPYINKPTKAIK